MPRSSSTPGPSRELAAKVRRLADTAVEAKHASFALPVTRLTALKSLCKDPEDAARFLLHLATAARDRIVHGRRPGHLTPATWQRHQTLAAEAVACMERHLDARRGGDAGKLSDLLLRLTDEQDEHKPAAWGDVRLIHNRDLLVVEETVEGVLVPEARAHQAYRAARSYAERYAPTRGNGLIPESAPRLEEIADFWCRRCFGVPLAEWRKTPATKPPKRAARRAPAPPRPQEQVVASAYPTIATWVAGGGQVEIGQTDRRGSFVRALDDGGLIWEGKASYASLDAALTALEQTLKTRARRP